MGIFTKVINILAKRHAGKFANNVNRQFDPQLYNAVWTKLDKKISLFMGNFSCSNVNSEMEVLQDIILDGMRLGYLDDVVDVVKYGKQALGCAKYKTSEYLLAYREALLQNMPALKGRGFIFDLRKGNVSDAEVNDVIKNIFLS